MLTPDEARRRCPQTEKEFQAQVEQLLKVRNWLYYHTWRSIHSAPGFPDLVCVRPPKMLLAELKREDGGLTVAQARWLGDLEKCNVIEAHCWRPSHWPEIEKILA